MSQGNAKKSLPGASGPASGDLAGNYPGPTVININGVSIPSGGSLINGNVLQVSGPSALTYAPINLAGGSGSVIGTLPAGNIGNLSGDVTGPANDIIVTSIQNNPIESQFLGSQQDGYTLKWINNQWVASPPWGTILDIDFTLQTSQGLGVDGTYTIDGYTFSKVNSSLEINTLGGPLRISGNAGPSSTWVVPSVGSTVQLSFATGTNVFGVGDYILIGGGAGYYQIMSFTSGNPLVKNLGLSDASGSYASPGTTIPDSQTIRFVMVLITGAGIVDAGGAAFLGSSTDKIPSLKLNIATIFPNLTPSSDLRAWLYDATPSYTSGNGSKSNSGGLSDYPATIVALKTSTNNTQYNVRYGWDNTNNRVDNSTNVVYNGSSNGNTSSINDQVHGLRTIGGFAGNMVGFGGAYSSGWPSETTLDSTGTNHWANNFSQELSSLGQPSTWQLSFGVSGPQTLTIGRVRLDFKL